MSRVVEEHGRPGWQTSTHDRARSLGAQVTERLGRTSGSRSSTTASREPSPRSANAFADQITTGSRVTAKAAGIESTAKAMSATMIATTASSSARAQAPRSARASAGTCRCERSSAACALARARVSRQATHGGGGRSCPRARRPLLGTGDDGVATVAIRPGEESAPAQTRGAIRGRATSSLSGHARP